MDCMGIYIRQVRKAANVKLSHADRVELRNRMLAGDMSARDELIMSVTPLVVNIVHKKFLWCGIDPADLIQVGNLGLIRAVDSWEPERGYLTTLCHIMVRQTISREIDHGDGVIRLPSNWRSFSLANKYSPETMAAIHQLRVVSASSADDEQTPFDRTFVSQCPPVGAEVELSEELSLMRSKLDQIDPRWKGVLLRRAEGEELRAIGEDIGVTRERVRQIETRAMQRIAEMMGCDSPDTIATANRRRARA